MNEKLNNNLNNISKDTSSNDIFSNLGDKTYTSNIDLIYHIDYLTYKKLLIKNISNDIEQITNLFDNEISEILINILILKKKNKIDNENFKIFEPIYDLIYFVDKLYFFDQEEFLIILINLFKINILTKKINIFANNFRFNDLIDLNNLTTKINNLFYEISKNNIFLKTFNTIISNTSENIITTELKLFAKYVSMDFFMYYNSNNIYNKIFNNILQLGYIINSSSDTFKSNEYLNFIKIFKKHKELFIGEYNKGYKKNLEIYSNYEFELKIKFKFKKKQNINNLIENFNFIKNYD